MTKIMFIFPGQGSQYKGIGKDLYSEFDIAKIYHIFHWLYLVLTYIKIKLRLYFPSYQIE